MIRYEVAFHRVRREWKRRMPAACFLALGVLGGCSSGDQAGMDPAWNLDEHGNPDFKPADFERAIAALKSQFGEIAAEPSPETSPRSWQFRQILRWLPEFAADTPIQRAGWEALAARASQMEAAAREPGFFEIRRAAEFGQEMDALAAMIPPDTIYRKLNSHSKSVGSPADETGDRGSHDSHAMSGSAVAKPGTIAGTGVQAAESKAAESKGEER